MRLYLGFISTTRTLCLTLLGLGVLCVQGRPALAKKVAIEWKALKGAAGYELKFQREGKTVSRKKIDEAEWSGDLPFGLYTYQIRGVDRIKRPGKWTEPLPLVVMPLPPELKSLDQGRKVTQYSSAAESKFTWTPVEGASQYRVEVLRKGAPPIVRVTTGDSLTLKALPPGDYQWKVTTLVNPKGRVPAAMSAKQWEGKSSALGEFTLERAQLEKPTPDAPLGTITPPGGGRVTFTWGKVEGADAYELEVFARHAPARAPAAGPIKPFARVVVTENTAIVTVPRDGAYSWRIRALASIGNGHVPAAVGPQSTANFSLDKNATFFEGSGYVALSTMFAPYTYHVESPVTGVGNASSSSITERISGEYWLRPQWGIAGAFELTQFQIGGESFSRQGFELIGKYRINFGEGKHNWSLSPKFGFEGRDYFEIFSPRSSITTFFSRVYGLQAGADLRKAFNDKFGVGIKFAYFRPLLLSSTGASALTSDASNRNISLGAQILYWPARRWGLGAGAYVERRSISYLLSNPPAGVSTGEQIFTDGTYFFGSVIYSFGR